MSDRPGQHLEDELWVCQLPTVPYRRAVEIQELIRERRLAGELPDALLLLEHPPVYTRGRRSADAELPLGEDRYRERGIEVLATDRGGRITYHGPGQLVGYPIMRVGDVHAYLRTMEAAIRSALAEEGVRGRSRHEEGIDYTGVWVQDRKIASIGVHLSHGVSTHGFAVNVENDLEPFSWVIACGLPDVTMTSLARELAWAPEGAPAPQGGCRPAGAPGGSTHMRCMRKRMAFAFCQAHGRRQRLVAPRALGIELTDAAGRAPGRASSGPKRPRIAEPVGA